MLNPFPQQLMFSFFAPTLLRVATACFFLYLASQHAKYHNEAAGEISVLDRNTARTAVWIYAAIECAVAVLLVIGLETQLAALIGLIICLKMLILKRNLHHLTPLSHVTYALLAVVCASLMMTGAGAFAFDLPL